VPDEERGLMAVPARVDRRAQARGDLRREALLEALDVLLRENALDTVNIADISRQAGVTRSAFYFYFESKAHAVLALMGEMYDEAAASAQLMFSGEGAPQERIEKSIRGLYDVMERHPHIYRAMLEARATNESVRATWESYRQSYVGPVAELVAAERLAGRALEGPDATALATVLLDLNDRALERLVVGGDVDREEHLSAVVAIWLRTIYGDEQGPTP
jgi:AcrR family transcriptional regulator